MGVPSGVRMDRCGLHLRKDKSHSSPAILTFMLKDFSLHSSQPAKTQKFTSHSHGNLTKQAWYFMQLFLTKVS